MEQNTPREMIDPQFKLSIPNTTTSARIESGKVQAPPVTTSEQSTWQHWDPQQRKPESRSSARTKRKATTTSTKQSTGCEKQIAELGPYDIICGRSSTAFQNVGNKRFRVTMSINLQRYMAAPSRKDKTIVILSIVQMMQQDLGARFLKLTENNGYVELDDSAVREKVGHALRDLALAHAREHYQNGQQEIEADVALSNSISGMMVAVNKSSSSFSSSFDDACDDDEASISMDILPFYFRNDSRFS
jgi:hypothetical protein